MEADFFLHFIHIWLLAGLKLATLSPPSLKHNPNINTCSVQFIYFFITNIPTYMHKEINNLFNKSIRKNIHWPQRCRLRHCLLYIPFLHFIEAAHMSVSWRWTKHDMNKNKNTRTFRKPFGHTWVYICFLPYFETFMFNHCDLVFTDFPKHLSNTGIAQMNAWCPADNEQPLSLKASTPLIWHKPEYNIDQWLT